MMYYVPVALDVVENVAANHIAENGDGTMTLSYSECQVLMAQLLQHLTQRLALYDDQAQLNDMRGGLVTLEACVKRLSETLGGRLVLKRSGAALLRAAILGEEN